MLGKEVEFLLIMASPKHVSRPVVAYLSLTVTYRPEQVENTTKIKWAPQFTSQWSPYQKENKNKNKHSRATSGWCFLASHLGGTKI